MLTLFRPSMQLL